MELLEWLESLWSAIMGNMEEDKTIMPTQGLTPVTTPTASVAPVQSTSTVTGTNTSKLDLWCAYAQKREGWFPGSTSYKNNNPGNLKYHGQSLAINTGPKDGSEFCVFKTYIDGYKTLYNMFLADCSGQSTVHPETETIVQYYQGILKNGVYVNGYAPADDKNDPLSYANGAAEAMAVNPDTQIKDLI